MSQLKGRSAPRVTLEDIEANIAGEYFFTAKEGVYGAGHVTKYFETWEPLALLTFCVLVLQNGYTVTGESACVSAENFDDAIGRRLARENAVAKIWPLMGYALKDSLKL